MLGDRFGVCGRGRPLQDTCDRPAAPAGVAVNCRCGGVPRLLLARDECPSRVHPSRCDKYRTIVRLQRGAVACACGMSAFPRTALLRRVKLRLEPLPSRQRLTLPPCLRAAPTFSGGIACPCRVCACHVHRLDELLASRACAATSSRRRGGASLPCALPAIRPPRWPGGRAAHKFQHSNGEAESAGALTCITSISACCRHPLSCSSGRRPRVWRGGGGRVHGRLVVSGPAGRRRNAQDAREHAGACDRGSRQR
jgi:hypothetical protein